MHPSSQNQHNNIKKSPAGTPYIIVVASIAIFLSLHKYNNEYVHCSLSISW